MRRLPACRPAPRLTAPPRRLRLFSGTRAVVERADGAMIPKIVSAYPQLLHRLADKRDWAAAVRLCRFIKEPSMWACLAGLAASAKDLGTAEIAYAAIEEVDKVEFIARIKKVPTEEGRSAEMALFCRAPAEVRRARPPAPAGCSLTRRPPRRSASCCRPA